MTSKDVRTGDGKFLPGKSGNPSGKPTGSKNQVTLLKILAEEAVRTNNADDMLKVCKQIIQKALKGNASCEKLVWNSMITKGSTDDRAAAQERVEININTTNASETITIDQTTPQEELEDNGN